MINQFMNKQNAELLWDVILDEFKIDNNSSSNIRDNVKTIFDTNFNIFVSKANPNLNLMVLNKQFLSQVVLAVNKVMPNLKEIKRIKIEETDMPYKIEDIHNSRKNEFDMELEKRVNDFEKYINPNKPLNVDFSDKIVETKIIEMDELIAQKINERNNDVNVLIKNEAIKSDKKVTWEDDNETNKLFNKLKKMDTNTNRDYNEQPSRPLPEISRFINPINNPINNHNEPILPMNEIIKMLNEMNGKVNEMNGKVNEMNGKVNEIYELLNKLVIPNQNLQNPN